MNSTEQTPEFYERYVEALADNDVHPRSAVRWFGGEYRRVVGATGKTCGATRSSARHDRSPQRAELDEALDEALFVFIVTREPNASQ